MLNYKQRQRDAEKAYKNRGHIIHVSCVVISSVGNLLRKMSVNGTYTCRAAQQHVRGKAAIKATRKLTHTKHYYRMLRGIKKLSKIAAVDLNSKNLYIDIEAAGLK